jgi:hypothetical protein
MTACGRIDFGGVAYPDVVLSDLPVAYYHLDETSGILAIDSSGLGHDGNYRTVQPGAYTQGQIGITGAVTSAALFEGYGNSSTQGGAAYVSVSAVLAVFAGDFTIEFFVKPTAPPVPNWESSLFACEHYLANGFRVGFDDKGAPGFWTDESGGTSHITLTTTVTPGAWSHFAVAKQGATMRMYQDGIERANTGISYLVPDAASTCGFGSLEGMPLHGVMDEVSIYDVALSASQIAAHGGATGN